MLALGGAADHDCCLGIGGGVLKMSVWGGGDGSFMSRGETNPIWASISGVVAVDKSSELPGDSVAEDADSLPEL